MTIKLKIPFRKGGIKVFFYDIPDWLVAGLIIVVLGALIWKFSPLTR